ncbi:hypothetical protein DN824_20425 [Stutzerimonas nosocomialis]|nr:hypothetical protein DN824_20425 [Stutzerimonas nosocomialis]
MPGVVAGFPRRQVGAGFTLVSAIMPPDEGTTPGNVWAGFNKSDPVVGSLNPPYASIVPGAPAVEGGNGEILLFACETDYFDQSQWWMYFWVAGELSAASFSSLSIDGQVFPSSAFTFDASDGTTWIQTAATLPGNVLPPGPHSVVFM